MLLQIVLLLLGFVMLIKGADIFVGASVNIARRLHIPSIVIGLTIVAIGTSAPEAVVSITASASGANTLAITNAIGSNMFNLLLIVGICALVKPIVVRFREMAKDFWIAAGSVGILLLFSLIFVDFEGGQPYEGFLPRYVGFIFFGIFVAYVIVLVRQALAHGNAAKAEAAAGGGGDVGTVAGAGGGGKPLSDAVGAAVAADPAAIPLVKNIIFAVLGAGMIVAGGQFTVNSATDIALRLDISQHIIGLTVVALGTSLPELAVSLVACKKGEGDVALGNVVGSSIFNVFFVLGLACAVAPLPVDLNIIFDLAIITVGSLVTLIFAYSSNLIVRLEGAALLLMYGGYMTYAIMR